MRGARRGSFATYFSTQMKMARTTRPPMMVPQTIGALQGFSLPRTRKTALATGSTMREKRLAAEREADKEESDGGDEREGAEEINALNLADNVARSRGDVDLPGDNGEVEDADGDLNQESPTKRARSAVARLHSDSSHVPAPSNAVSEPAADGSSQSRTESTDEGTKPSSAQAFEKCALVTH